MFETGDWIKVKETGIIIKATSFDVGHSDKFLKATSREIAIKFSTELNDLLIKYNVHLYVCNEEDAHINTDVIECYSEKIFAIDFEQPIKG